MSAAQLGAPAALTLEPAWLSDAVLAAQPSVGARVTNLDPSREIVGVTLTLPPGYAPPVVGSPALVAAGFNAGYAAAQYAQALHCPDALAQGQPCRAVPAGWVLRRAETVGSPQGPQLILGYQGSAGAGIPPGGSLPFWVNVSHIAAAPQGTQTWKLLATYLDPGVGPLRILRDEGPFNGTQVVDRAPPAVAGSLSGAPDGHAGWFRTPPLVLLAASDAPSPGADAASGVDPASLAYALALGGGPFGAPQPWAPPVALPSAAGVQVRVLAADLAGNAAHATLAAVDVDGVAPSVGLALLGPGPNAAGWHNATPSVAASASDAVSGLAPGTLAVAVAGGPFQGYAAPVPLPDGAAVVAQARAEDVAGNAGTATLGPVQVDTHPPQVAVAVAPAAPDGSAGWYRAAPIATASHGDALSGAVGPLEVRVLTAAQPDPPWLAYAGPWALPDGAGATVQARTLDAAGNGAQTSAGPFQVDTQPPSIAASVVAPPGGPGPYGWHSSPPTLQLAAGDAASGLALVQRAWVVDGVQGPWVPHPADAPYADGLEVRARGRAVDAAGHEALTPPTAPYKVDATGPSVALAASPAAPDGNAGWFRTAPTLTASATDALSGLAGPLEFRIGAGPWLEVTGPFTLPAGAAVGAEARAFDLAGNTGIAGLGPFAVDPFPPSLAYALLGTPAPSGWYTARPRFTLDAAENLSGLAALQYRFVLAGAPGPWTHAVPGSGTQVTLPEDPAAQVEVRAEDGAGHVAQRIEGPYAIDATPPAAGVLLDPAAPDGSAGWYRTRPRGLAVASPDAAKVTYQVKVEGTVVEQGDYLLPVLLPEGRNVSFHVEVRDVAGNAAQAATPPLHVDPTPPAAALALAPATPAGGWHAARPQASIAPLDGTSGIAQVVYRLVLDGAPGAWQQFTGPVPLPEGRTVLEANVTDHAGHAALLALPLVQVDLTPPAVGFAVAPSAPDGAGGWDRTTPSVLLSPSDAPSGLASVEVRAVVDGQPGPWAPHAGGPVPLPDGGQVVLQARLADLAGHGTVASSPARSVDTVPPILTAALSPAAPGPGGWYLAQPLASLAAQDARSPPKVVHRVLVDGVEVAPWSPTTGPVKLPEGAAVRLEAEATDAAGHATAAAVGPVAVDLAAPQVQALAPLGVVLEGTHRIRARATDAVGLAPATLHVVLDGAPVAVALDPLGEVAFDAPLAKGAHTVEVRVQDLAGREGSATWTFQVQASRVRLDATPAAPDGAGGWYRSSPTVRATCEPAGARCAIALDEGAPIEGQGAQVSVPPGRHRVTGSSNLSGEVVSASLDVQVDPTPPTALLDGPRLVAGQAQVQAGGSDALSGVARALAVVRGPGGQRTVPLGGLPATVPVGPGPGAYTVSLEVVDGAGHIASASHALAIDGTPPTSQARAAAAWFRDSLAVQALIEDDHPGAAADLWARSSPEGTAWGPWRKAGSNASAFTFTPDEPGERWWQFATLATDAVGHAEAKALAPEAAARRDATPPVLSAGATPPPSSAWLRARPVLSASAQDAGPVALEARACNPGCGPWRPFAAGTLALAEEGDLLVEVRAVDAAGNAAHAPPMAFRVDATPPSASFTALVDGLTVTLDATATDNVGVAAWTWAFDDGTQSQGPRAQRTYPTPGPRPVRLTVFDAAGHAGEAVRTVEPALPPVPPAPSPGSEGDCTPRIATSPEGQGTRVSVALRCPGVQQASLVVLRDGASLRRLDLRPASDGSLAASFTLDDAGAYRFDFDCEGGARCPQRDVVVAAAAGAPGEVTWAAVALAGAALAVALAVGWAQLRRRRGAA